MRLTIPADSPFTIHTLPYGVFRPEAGTPARVGVAAGDWVMDLARLAEAGVFEGPALNGGACFARPALNEFMALGRPAWDEARAVVQRLLVEALTGSRPVTTPLRDALLPRADVELLLPANVGDYTDFYSSREHATHVGAMFRGAEQALQPNWLHLPVAYHGRAGTLVPGGQPIMRPSGQRLPPGANTPVFGPTEELDYELEVGFFVGPGNEPGAPIVAGKAAGHIFGLVLVNDWSARDMQRWEYRPLGPFLSKNFATSVSPWVVPLPALEPLRCPGPRQDPRPLPYLRVAEDWAFDIRLEVSLLTPAMAEMALPPHVLARTNFRYLYWNMAQQLAHQTSNGCTVRPGDLLASGTISGPSADALGSLLELTWGGQRPISLPSGETRRYLADGDRLTLAGWGERGDYRVGFGELTAVVQPPG